jgi:hypothetical protein
MSLTEALQAMLSHQLPRWERRFRTEVPLGVDLGDTTQAGPAVHLDQERQRTQGQLGGLRAATTIGLSPTSRRQLIRAHQRVVRH